MLVERLLNEPKLTYETAAEICRTYEVARNTQFSDSCVNVVNEVKNNYKRGVGLKCFCCGKSGHFKRECKFKHASCFKCGKKGHLREMCRSKRQREKNDFKVFKVSSFKDNPALFNNTLSDLSWDRGKSYVCGDTQGQDDSGRRSHSG